MDGVIPSDPSQLFPFASQSKAKYYVPLLSLYNTFADHVSTASHSPVRNNALRTSCSNLVDDIDRENEHDISHKALTYTCRQVAPMQIILVSACHPAADLSAELALSSESE